MKQCNRLGAADHGANAAGYKLKRCLNRLEELTDGCRKKIKDIYNISFKISDVSKEDRCPMQDWYSNLINKNFHQLDLFDVTRMLIQKMFLELAVLKAISFIRENPFCGQRYESELLELLSKLDRCYLKKYTFELEEILRDAKLKNKEYDWLCKDERKEFSDMISNFFKKLQAE